MTLNKQNQLLKISNRNESGAILVELFETNGTTFFVKILQIEWEKN